MHRVQVFNESWSVESKLTSLGITKQELITVALKAITAKNDAISIDPINTPGQLAYIYGVRAIREMLLPKAGWEIDRTDNIEGTLNSESKIKIIYQNVDYACTESSPKAISGKGSAVKRLVENNTGFLWPEMENEFKAQVNTSIWFFCVSSHGDEIRAELSRPRSIEGNQFGDDFLERIFIITNNDWNPVKDDDGSNSSEQDYDIPVTKK